MPKSSINKKSHSTKRRRRRRGKGSSSSSSKKNKSKKKIRRRSRSLPDSYDTDSTASSSSSPSMSVSSSSASEEYHSSRKRSRSLTRKARKKRAMSPSQTSDSTEEAHRYRKRRRSNKKGEHLDRARDSVREVKKKKKKKNKKKKKKQERRRDVSVSESWSCSTCPGSSSGDESEFDRKRARKAREGGVKGTSKSRNLPSSSRTTDSNGYWSGEKKVKYTRQGMSANDIARLGEKASPLYVESVTRKHMRSRSCSPLGRSIDSTSYQSEDDVMKVNNVRKLRSVITVVRQEENLGTSEGGDLKQKIPRDLDCHQSSRINRTGNSMETHHANVTLESIRHADDGQGQTVITPGAETACTVKEFRTDDDGNEKGNFGRERETEVSASLGSLNVDDLESILRQRALENLRKFRGGKQTNAIESATREDEKDCALKMPHSFKDDPVQISCKEDHGGAGTAVQTSEQLRQPIPGIGAPAPMPLNTQKTPDDNGISQELGAPLLEGSLQDKKYLCHVPKEKLNAAVDAGRDKSQTSSFEQRSHGMRTKTGHIPTAQESSAANLATGSSGKERPSGTSESDITDKVNRVPGSADMQTAVISTSGDIRSENLQSETMESSEFEKKTMSVMRGGEMVQVSYKVYIPKKAPALARRKLKR